MRALPCNSNTIDFKIVEFVIVKRRLDADDGDIIRAEGDEHERVKRGPPPSVCKRLSTGSCSQRSSRLGSTGRCRCCHGFHSLRTRQSATMRTFGCSTFAFSIARVICCFDFRMNIFFTAFTFRVNLLTCSRFYFYFLNNSKDFSWQTRKELKKVRRVVCRGI